MTAAGRLRRVVVHLGVVEHRVRDHRHLLGGPDGTLDGRLAVHLDELPREVAPDRRAGTDADGPLAGGDVARYLGARADGDTLAGAQTAEQFGVPTDHERLGADVPVEAAVVTDAGRRRDAPGVVGDATPARDEHRLVVAVVGLGDRREQFLGGVLLTDAQQL